MPLIQATIIEGRTQQQKDAFFEGVAKVAAETLNAPLPSIRVVITEVPAEHWSIGGVNKARIDAEKAAGA
jgi:4-oxalocrotonate tautomerase